MNVNKKVTNHNIELGTSFRMLASEISRLDATEISSLSGLSAYRAVKGEMEKDTVIARHFNKDVQFGIGGFRGDVTVWLDYMLSVFLARKETDIRTELAADVYSEFEDFFYSEELKLIAVAPVQGLGMFKENEELRTATSRRYDDEERPLSLAEDLELSALTSAESVMTHQMEIVRRHHIRMTTTTYAIKYAFKTRKTILDSDLSPQDGVDAQNEFSRAINEASVRIEQALTALRLFKPGRILMGGLLIRSRDAVISNYTALNSTLPNPYFDPNPYIFDLEKEGRALVSLYNSFVRATTNQPNLVLAARWFRKAGEADSFEDRVIALVIAAEALSKAAGKEGKGTHVSTFVSNLFPDKRIEVGSLLKSFYGLRNSIMHDGAMSEWIRKNLSTSDDLPGVIYKNAEVIREALIIKMAEA